MNMKRNKWVLMAGENEGAAGGAGGAAGTGDNGAGDNGGAGDSGATDWRAAFAGEDNAVLESLKDVEPKMLLEAHTNQVKWRENLAGDNKDALKTLERFTSPKALWESYDTLRGRMAKGELKNATAYPEKGTPEQQAVWRTENGIPAEPSKYEITIPENASDADKAAVEGLAKFAFEKNLPAVAAGAAAEWYFADKAAREEAAYTQFEQNKSDTAAQLGQEWGPEYKANMNKIQGVIDSTIPGDQAELKTLINKAISTNAHFARHYAAIALQLNPSGTLVPGDRGANEGSISDEIKKIESAMRSDRSAYNKDEGMQKRYRDLLEGYGKLTGKDWGR